MGEVTVSRLTVYPVKGCQGTALTEATVTERGLLGDRVFALVEDGTPLDQIKSPELGGLGVSWDAPADELVFSHPRLGRFVHRRRLDGESISTKYLLDSFESCDQGDEVAQWLSRVTGRSVRLITAGRPWRQNLPLKQFERLHQTLRERFYAVSPVSISNIASLTELNGRLESPVPMNRFRMNLVVEGLEPFQENEIHSLSTTTVCLERVTVAERCIIVSTDQETGERKKSDLLPVLEKYYRRPKEERFSSGLVFGVYMAVEQAGILRLGDKMTVA